MQEITVFKLTQDNWYPSYKLNGFFEGQKDRLLVSVSFIENISPPGDKPISRICVWGGDDIGMEHDCLDAETAFEIFTSVIKLPFVNKENLSLLGFVQA